MQTAVQNRNIRNNLIAQDRIDGLTYKQLSEKYDLANGSIQTVLNKPEIKMLIDGGTSQIIALIPQACLVQYNAMRETNKAGFPTSNAQKASELVLKTGSIVPSNVTNQRVSQVFNIQTNITLSPGVAQAMGFALSNDDNDVIDVESGPDNE